MLDAVKLHTLREVAVTGSMAAAARHLGYTRSAVSQQISALERAVATPLVVRTSNRIELTATGRRLVAHAERVIDELRSAEAAARSTSDEIVGDLRVGIPFGSGPPLMSRSLTEVRRAHPGLTITLTATTDETVEQHIRHGTLDVAISSKYGPPVDTDTRVRRLAISEDPLRLCVPADHRLAGEASCALSALVNEGWLLNPSDALGRIVLGACESAGFSPRITGVVDHASTALGLCALGWGVTVAPELTPAPRSVDIVRIPVEDLDNVRRTVVLVREGQQVRPEIALVISALESAPASGSN